jgi:hypothetical protein
MSYFSSESTISLFNSFTSQLSHFMSEHVPLYVWINNFSFFIVYFLAVPLHVWINNFSFFSHLLLRFCSMRLFHSSAVPLHVRINNSHFMSESTISPFCLLYFSNFEKWDSSRASKGPGMTYLILNQQFFILFSFTSQILLSETVPQPVKAPACPT